MSLLSYFLPLVQLRRGSDRAAWSAPGIQPGSTHHTTLLGGMSLKDRVPQSLGSFMAVRHIGRVTLPHPSSFCRGRSQAWGQESGVEEILTQNHPGQRVRSALEPEQLHTCLKHLPASGNWRCHLDPPFPFSPQRNSSNPSISPSFVACSIPHPTQQPHAGLTPGCHCPSARDRHWPWRCQDVGEVGGGIASPDMAGEIGQCSGKGRVFLAAMWGLCSALGAFLGGPREGEGR